MCTGRFVIHIRKRKRQKNESAQANPVRRSVRDVPRALRLVLLNHREQLLIADHHNVVDTTMWDIFAVVMALTCVGVAVLVKKLLNDEENG